MFSAAIISLVHQNAVLCGNGLQGYSSFSLDFCFMLHICYTVKPVLETTCIKQPTALRDHFSDTAPLPKST